MYAAGHLSDEEFRVAKQTALRSSGDSPALSTETGAAGVPDRSARSEAPSDAVDCATCGEALQREGAFCGACGTQAGSSGQVPSRRGQVNDKAASTVAKQPRPAIFLAGLFVVVLLVVAGIFA